MFTENEGKVVQMIHQHLGIFVIALDSNVHDAPVPGGSHSPFSNLPFTVSRIIGFDSHYLLEAISCLQITNTGLYFNWEPGSQPNIMRQVIANHEANPTSHGGNTLLFFII